MQQLIKQLHKKVNKEKLKVAPEKSVFMLLTVKSVNHEVSFSTIKPIQPKIAAILKFTCPTTKIKLMRFIGLMNFYSVFIEKHLVIMMLLYD